MARIDSMGDIVCPDCNGRGGLHFEKCPADEHVPTTVLILKDVLDGIEHFYGKEGLDNISSFALAVNRSRESNRLMDELEARYGTHDDPRCNCGHLFEICPQADCTAIEPLDLPPSLSQERP